MEYLLIARDEIHIFAGANMRIRFQRSVDTQVTRHVHAGPEGSSACGRRPQLRTYVASLEDRSRKSSLTGPPRTQAQAYDYFASGLSFSEIAAAMNIKETTAQ